ncbi:MAG: PAS domain S-box protein [Acidimicrobiia bacterium]|nr:PAS domain S-box protein [Acidimicrobiia bacterium]
MDRLEEVIVRVTTWVSLAFLVLLLATGAITGDEKFFVRALNPLLPGAAGVWMLLKEQPRALVQLGAGAIAVATTTGLADIASRPGALLGLLSMGIVGALLVRRHVVIYLVVAGTALFAVSMWWASSDLSPRDRAVEAAGPVFALLLTAGLVIWLKRALLMEGERRHEAAKALAASEEQFRTAFETSAATMALVRASDLQFLRVNQAGCEMLGYTEDELLRMTVPEVIHPDDQVASRTRMRQLLAGEEQGTRGVVRYLKSDGSIVYGLVSAALVSDADGNPSHFVAQLVDTTDQHHAEQRLMDLLASRDELIASVSHELRTPLTAVLGYASLLLEELPGTPEGYEDMLREIFSQGRDLVGIIEDLLVFAQSDSDSITVKPVQLDVRDQATLVLESLRTELSVDHIDLVGPRVEAFGDPLRVRQVLRNLLSNAVRYGGSSIVVEMSESNSTARIVVSDDGSGVPREDRERIFEPYQRSQPKDGLTASIGVGLTVARRLARLMNGDLTYEYRDGRSRFSLSLPKYQARKLRSA